MHERVQSETRRSRGRAVMIATIMAAGVCGCALLAGCQDPLLSARETRSPFDRYDAVRNQHAPQFIEDQYGRRQPNLRGRLQPKE